MTWSRRTPRRGGRQRERAVLAVDLLLELHTATAVADFRPEDLRAWQARLCRLPSLKTPGGKRFSASAVNYHVDAVRRLWRWGAQAERTTDERWQALKAAPRPKIGEARAPKVVGPATPGASGRCCRSSARSRGRGGCNWRAAPGPARCAR